MQTQRLKQVRKPLQQNTNPKTASRRQRQLQKRQKTPPIPSPKNQLQEKVPKPNKKITKIRLYFFNSISS